MSKWALVKLGDVFISIKNGASIKQGDIKGLGYPITRIETIALGNVNRLKMGYAEIYDITEYSNDILEDGDILMSHINSVKHLGKTALYEKEDNEIIIHGMNLLRLRPNKELLLSKYGKYFFESCFFKNQLPRITKNSVNQSSFNVSALEDLRIILPTLDIQKKIATALDTANTLIEKRKEQIEKLDLLIKSQFIEMFGDPVTNPKGWERTPMGKYIALLTDFSANGSYEYLDSNIVMSNEPGYALMVRTTDLEKNDFEKDVKYIDIKAYEILKKSKLFGNEIIINKIGSAGKVYIMPVIGKPASLGRNAFMIRYKSDINIKFIYYLLVSRYGEREIQKHIRGAVTKTITKEAVKSIQILCPPLYLQTQFAEFVEKVEAQKTLLQKSLADMEQNYQSLLQKCFKGEIF